MRILTVSTFCCIVSLMHSPTTKAQQVPWQPIPFGQTSHFVDQGAPPSVYPMTADAQHGDTVGIFEQHFSEQYPCPDAIWAQQNFFPRPSDIYSFVMREKEIMVSTYQNEYLIPLFPPGDSLFEFHATSGMTIRIDSVLGTAIDSIRYYSIFDETGAMPLGFIELSSVKGLLHYTPFEALDELPQAFVNKSYTLLGYENNPILGSSWTNPYTKELFMPYEAGDRMLIERVNAHAPNYVLDLEYIDLTIESVHIDPDAYVIGVAEFYDDQGHWLGSDSNYQFDFDPFLTEAVTMPHHVPFNSLHNDQGGYTLGMVNIGVNFEGHTSLVIYNYEILPCDSFAIVDGYYRVLSMNENVGFLSYEESSIGHFDEYSLLGVELNGQIVFGSWLHWLGAKDVSDENDWTIYPNPVNDRIQFSADEPIEIVLMNLNGQVIQHISVNETEREVDLTHLPSGTYIVMEPQSGTVKRLLKT